MKRTWWLTAVLLLVPLQGQEPDLLLERMVKFDRAWMAFKLEYIGCPQHGWTTDSSGVLLNCSGSGSVDYQKLKTASKEAQKLFHLIPEPQ